MLEGYSYNFLQSVEAMLAQSSQCLHLRQTHLSFQDSRSQPPLANVLSWDKNKFLMLSKYSSKRFSNDIAPNLLRKHESFAAVPVGSWLASVFPRKLPK
jgi:hypothetical protein